ncbi:MAG TPA: hypothetical protein PKL57_03555 [Candidatus Wallbacteria bacterium]|nr:hypothetical protein [Candidatus Wallbacteria bacterium]
MNLTSEIKLIVPAIDSVPLMGHPALEKILLVFTFILHLIPMNILLGSVIIAAALKTQKLIKYGNYDLAYRLYRDILKMLPTALSLTITLGVAPLLFLQSLYGPLFYTSTILMAPFWLLILAFIMVSYYILYLLGWTEEKVLRPLRLPLLLAALAGLLYTAFMYGSNNSLMQAPQKFHSIYNSTFYGLYIYLSDINIILRFLHVIAGSILIASIAIFTISYFKKETDRDFAVYTADYLRPVFLLAFSMQALIGFSMLFAQKPEIYSALMGKNVLQTGALWLGVAFAAVQLIAAHFKGEYILKKATLITLLISAFACLCLMAVTRDFIRDAEIGSAFSYMSNPYQWNVIVLGAFFITLAGGLAVCAYMLFGLKEIKKP